MKVIEPENLEQREVDLRTDDSIRSMVCDDVKTSGMH
jgi:hypothetical protein